MDGAAVAKKIRTEVAAEVADLKERGITPGLAVVLVGDDPASAVYVAAKGRACEEAGIHSVTIRLPADTTQEALLRQVDALNSDRAIDGILVQMPLPKHMDCPSPSILAAKARALLRRPRRRASPPITWRCGWRARKLQWRMS